MWNFEKFSSKLNEKTEELRKNVNEGLNELSKTVKEIKLEDVLEKTKNLGNNLNLDSLQKDSMTSEKTTSSNTNKSLFPPMKSFKLTDGINDLRKGANNVVKTVQDNILTDQKVFVEVYPRLFHTNYPGYDTSIAQAINKRFNESFLVINLSEKKYPKGVFNGTIFNYTFPGFSCCPLDVLFKMILDIENYLLADKTNNVFIHCLSSNSRSFMLLSCLVSYFSLKSSSNDVEIVVKKTFKDVAELISYNQKTLLPSQKKYIDYFTHILSSIKENQFDFFEISKQCLILKSIKILKSVKNFMSEEDEKDFTLSGIRPQLKVYDRSRTLFSSVQREKNRKVKPKVYTNETVEANDVVEIVNQDWFEFNDINLELHGDILLRVTHIDSTSGKTQQIFRFVLNTTFELLRKKDNEFTLKLKLNDLDVPNKRFTEGELDVELLLKVGETKLNENFWFTIKDKIGAKLKQKEESKDEEEKFIIEEDSSKTEAKQKSKEALEKFEAELELLSHAKIDEIKEVTQDTVEIEQDQESIIENVAENESGNDTEGDLAELEEYFLTVENEVKSV